MNPAADAHAYADCLLDSSDGCHLAVRVVPRAGRTAIAGVRGGAVLVRLAAAPVEGAANEALVAHVAAVLGVPRRAVTLLSGARSRDKRLLIAGVGAQQVASRLASSTE